jgi:hypothetical protein
VITNSVGSVTSVVAQVAVQTYGTANLTNGIVAYWPLDAINGVKTPEMVSAYDLTVNNMGASNVVAGKWGNALTSSAQVRSMPGASTIPAKICRSIANRISPYRSG